MSHVAGVVVEINSMEALHRACQQLGVALNLHQKTFNWYGRWANDYHSQDAAYHLGINPQDYGKCEHAIVNPDNSHPYEVGVVKNPKGPGYLLLVDFWGMNQPGHICNKVGKHCEKLIQEYKAQAAMLKTGHLLDDGLTKFSRQVLADNSIQIVYEES